MGLNRRSFIRALVGVPFAAKAIEGIIARGISAPEPVAPAPVSPAPVIDYDSGKDYYVTPVEAFHPARTWTIPQPTTIRWTAYDPGVHYQPGDTVFWDGQEIGWVDRVRFNFVQTGHVTIDTDITVKAGQEEVAARILMEEKIPGYVTLVTQGAEGSMSWHA